MRNYTRNGEKTIKQQIREYLLEHKKILSTTAENEFGWYRFKQYMFELRTKEGMNIKSERIGNSTLYTLQDDQPCGGIEIIEAEPQENLKQEIKLQPEDMHIKTTMKQVILDHLKKHKTITSAVAMEKYRCLNLYNVISRLREEGWVISRSSTKENNDFNVASNRNNAYIVYTLENKTRKKPVYRISHICQLVINDKIPEYITIHIDFDSAMKEMEKATDLMVEQFNLFYGNSIVEFVKVIDDDSIMVVKKETVKKLFRKTYNTTMLAKFTINMEEVEV